MTLDQLFIKYGSDKSSLGHNYSTFYESHFNLESPKILLEIGVREGASIRAWKEFLPNTRIIGLDLFLDNPIPNIEGVEFLKGNQLDHEILYHIRNDIKPDVIIDDGSHNTRDQMVTFHSLFHKDCRYFIEDIHCEKEEFYRQGLPEWYVPSRLWNAWNDCQSPITLIQC